MKFEFIEDFLKEAKKNDNFRTLRNIVPFSARKCIADGRRCLNFSSNDYLGLSNHPDVIAESTKWVNKYGAGSGASRLVTGTIDAYENLENEIAEWKGAEAALIFGSGFLANSGMIPALAGHGTEVFADKLNHASLNAGCRLSDGDFKRFRHNDLGHLEKLLEKSAGSSRKLIVDETIFSMDGDMSDVEGLQKIAQKYDAILYLDDAHGSGLFGARGEGLANPSACDIAMGTFSKALGSYGAYAACSKELRDYFINSCGSFIYSTALPPAVCGAISAALKIVQSPESSEIRTALQKKAAKLRSSLQELGFDTGESSSHIIPVVLGSSETTMKVSKFFYENNILVTGIRPPTVPAGKARVRITVNAIHTEEDMALLIKKFKEIKEKIS
ncbi:MAG: 8-amino-7-oxononanoate synthase [Lentisphaerae bacterium GWF2_45_14]|nr:MAG: 8-amino-7-oxononanoate synthase [Lentisphaerae bacterium GWF2_45_14]